ncbi:UDP-4-amino-4,6-dideoxy-N-acetyl-beta-L-altrosamine transaminase [Candidatus Peribacteria bacterium RIFCSPHIGHO2_01_FULL_51_9]|nr:MAG: UDP-4-amino-4,6-dideoxy-N-acetyl-beta-L-altrosamine transaminase [Candidatus Peribacteria bacterium RIFCSPHIGHO2_01_FULL_51_9]
MKKVYIPYSTQNISNADIRAVARSLKSPWLTQGPAVASFEKAVARKVGAKYAVAVSSGTAALHAAYFAAGITKGDEVLVPAITFAGTGNAALYLGAKPVFVDIELADGTMSISDAHKKITKKTKAIVPVDYGGRPTDLGAFRALAKKHKLILIEDGAQSFGASYSGTLVGTQADMTIFSFHPVKSITTGEGGIITTNSRAYNQALRLFRHHGISKDPHTFSRKGYGPWYQEMQALGYNYRLTDIQAALGESQLKRLDGFIAKRRAAAQRYDKLLRDISALILPPLDREGEQSSWHLYPIRLAPAIAHRRDAVLAALRKKGIGAQVHYLPVYLHLYYERLGYKKGLCPKAEEFAASEISIPLFPGITKEQQTFIVRQLRSVLSRFS